ncbi:MAG: hypothetical protein NZ937_03950 [Armatimonadetes bacterium]|nr:hypothetical protein [Armatimonadota bacterium]
MSKSQCLRCGLLLLGLIGTFVIGFWLWYLSRPYTHVTTFLQIPFGEGKNQISKFAIIDLPLPARSITVTGFLSFDEKLNVCLSDNRRKKGERFLFFDSKGRLKHYWLREDKRGTYSVCIALTLDGSIWASGVEYATYSSCVRKYDKRGRVMLQFGELSENQAEPVTPELKHLLTKRYHHLWGSAYRFGDAKIQGLWVDRKGRVYVLTEYPSLHVFCSDGKPLVVFDADTSDKMTFQGDLGNLEGGTPSFVDWEGRIYTVRIKVERQRSMIGKIFYFMKHWVKGWEWEKEVTRYWVEVWEWEKEVKKVFSIEVPEVGCVVGVDGQDAIYFSSFGNKRVYQINRFGRVSKIFEPHRWYQNLLRKEWEILFSQDPKLKEKIERKWQAWEAERKQRILENPSLKRELRSYRDIYEYAMMSYGGGPRVGHIAHVDREGNLYLTLVTARHFRIDKVESSSRWERWQRKLFGH